MIAAALSLTVIYIPQYFRVVRNTTVSAREATYVEAARAIGATDATIMRRYLFGNVIQSVPVIGTLNAADAICTLAGARLPRARHPAQRGRRVGLRPRSARSTTPRSGIWWTALYPGLAIVLLVTGLTLVGEGLNETVNPTLRNAGACCRSSCRRARPTRRPRSPRRAAEASR